LDLLCVNAQFKTKATDFMREDIVLGTID